MRPSPEVAAQALLDRLEAERSMLESERDTGARDVELELAT